MYGNTSFYIYFYRNKIVFLDAFTVDPEGNMLEALSGLGDLVICDLTSYDKVIEKASDAEILIVNKCPIDVVGILVEK